MLVKLDRHGAITIPEELREGLDQDTLFAVVRREDGVIELRPQASVDVEQSWFWTERWQRMEQEADAAIAAGRVATFDDAESFLADLAKE